VNQHLSKLAATKEVEESPKEQDSQPPPGFEFEFEGDINLQDHTSARRTISNGYAKQQGVDEECLGVQTNILCRTDIEKVCTNQNSQQQYQEVSKELNFKKALIQSNSETTSSDSDSLVQLAHDSLKFGELIGVRVTGNVEAAISRIVSPLKKIRKQGKKLKKTTKD